MADDDSTSSTDTTESGDDGFTSESASVAFTQAPDDTTAHLGGDASSDEASASAAEATGELEDTGDEKPEAAGAETDATETARTAKGGQKAKGKSTPLSQRTSDLKKEVDRITHEKYKTQGELEEAQRTLTAKRAEIEALEKKRGIAGPDTGETREAKPDDLEPQHPEYREFNTDEEFEAAKAKWRTDHAAWDHRRIEAIKKDIEDGVETRLRSRDATAAADAAEQTLRQVITKVSAGKPDWDAKREAISDLRSSWYDPAIHGEQTSPTPFLTDVTATLLQQGRDEGAELAYWLGSDVARAQRVADLLPTRPVRDAIVRAPSVIRLFEHFATPAGAKEFERLKQMHPIDMMQAVGALSVRLQPVPRGSGATAHSITNASPSARPPAGSPGARGGGTSGEPPFENWMDAEDARELRQRMEQAGLVR